MGLLSRLGRVVRSYIDDVPITKRPLGTRAGDPDLDSAYEELESFLNGEETPPRADPRTGSRTGSHTGSRTAGAKMTPPQVIQDLAELGLEPGATAEECKEAYKEAIKKHHPDRHQRHEGNLKKATAKTTRLNAAYGRLMEWYK